MCGKLLFIEKMCAKNKHGKISITKPLEFYFKILFLSNPPLDLCQTYNNFCLGGVEGSFQNSVSSG
jgi:hypothetical protein